MTAIAAAPQDGEILSLFRQWIDAHRAAERVNLARRPQEEFDAACEAVWRVQHQILDTPAQGAIGFAVKAYFLAHHEYGPTPWQDPAGLFGFNREFDGDDPEQKLTPHCFASLMRDAARFVPEIAELAAPMIRGEVTQRRPSPASNVVPLRARKR